MPRTDKELPENLKNYLLYGPQTPTFSIPPEARALTMMRISIRHEWERHLGGKFWFGPDIPVIDEVVLPPRSSQMVRVRVNPEELPTYVGSFGHDCAETTTRSRWAQEGVEVSQKAGKDIATHYTDGESLIGVKNFALRPIRIKAGQSICYQFYRNNQMLSGEALEAAIGKSIRIEGQENVDWKRWKSEHPIHGGASIGYEAIEFMINPDSEAYVPEGDEPMELDDGPATNHNRASVDKYLVKPVPETDEFILVINETTAKIDLDETVLGICDISLTPNNWSIVDDRFRQLNSVGAKGGNTYGHLRGEFYAPTLRQYKPNSILLRFYKA